MYEYVRICTHFLGFQVSWPVCVCFTQNTRFSGWRMFWQRLQLVTVSSDTILRYLFRLLFAWSALWRTAHTKTLIECMWIARAGPQAFPWAQEDGSYYMEDWRPEASHPSPQTPPQRSWNLGYCSFKTQTCNLAFSPKVPPPVKIYGPLSFLIDSHRSHLGGRPLEMLPLLGPVSGPLIRAHALIKVFASSDVWARLPEFSHPPGRLNGEAEALQPQGKSQTLEC